MFIRGPIPQVMNPQIDNPIFLSAFHDAFAKRGATDVRKQCQNIDLHWEENVERPAANVK
jgi:hypothetical protein